MRRRTMLVLVAVAALATVPALGSSAGGATGSARVTTVKVGDNFFKPSRRAVRRGTKVRFRWVGSNPHNVFKARGPGGRFKSRTTSRRGVNFAKRFTRRGTYRLICTIHPRTMRLKLSVR